LKQLALKQKEMKISGKDSKLSNPNGIGADCFSVLSFVIMNFLGSYIL
jgi:hypothetical protein